MYLWQICINCSEKDPTPKMKETQSYLLSVFTNSPVKVDTLARLISTVLTETMMQQVLWQ